MQEKAKKNKITNRKIADSGGKIIFENPVLCSQLLREYSDLEMLKDIKPEDIEDVTERFIPMFMEERDADVVKKVHLNDEDIFIALIEHKSGVDYNVCMQILRYMVYIWEDYLKLGLSDEYLKGLLADTTTDVLDVISKVVSVVLRKQNIPETEIQDVLDQIKEGRNMALFDNYKGFDVQEERKNGKVQLLIKQICENLQKGKNAKEVSEFLGLSEEIIDNVGEIASDLGYDYDKVYDKVKDMAIQLV